MIKTKILNEWDWLAYQRDTLSGYDHEKIKPDHYPCVVILTIVYSLNSNPDRANFSFVYKGDFE